MLHDSHPTAAQYLECLTKNYAPTMFGTTTHTATPTTVWMIDGVVPIEHAALQALIANGVVKIVKDDDAA